MLISCQSGPFARSGLDEIHRLDDAANFLMTVSDGVSELEETCQLTPTQALELMQPLHALIDEEIRKKDHIVTDKELTRCESNCHCGIDSELALNEQLKNDLFKKAASFPKKRLLQCAQKTAKWFCTDKLLKTLKAELVNSQPNGL